MFCLGQSLLVPIVNRIPAVEDHLGSTSTAFVENPTSRRSRQPGEEAPSVQQCSMHAMHEFTTCKPETPRQQKLQPGEEAPSVQQSNMHANPVKQSGNCQELQVTIAFQTVAVEANFTISVGYCHTCKAIR
jgi:hypothetical protein